MVKSKTVALIGEVSSQIDIDEDEVATIVKSIKSIHLFDDVEDFRNSSYITYRLEDILLMVFLVVLERGVQSFFFIADYLSVNIKRFRSYGLDYETMPSHDTLRRVFSLLDSKSLADMTIGRIYSYLEGLTSTNNNSRSLLSVDGKMVNGTGRKDDCKKPKSNYNVLNVYDHTNSTCIESLVIDNKTNEIPTARDILSAMNLKNRIITADAMHCHHETLDLIKERKGHYLITVKDNQKLLHADIKARMKENDRMKIIEREKYTIEILNLPKGYECNEFKNIRSYVKLVSSKVKKRPCTRYFITDLIKESEIEYAVENRWDIENGLHKTKDTYLHEDDFRCTDSCAVKNMVIMNNLITQLLEIYIPLSGYNTHKAKIALRCNPAEEIAKVLAIMSSETITAKLKEQIAKKLAK